MTGNPLKTITITAPVYNEERIISEFLSEISKTVAGLKTRYCFQILLVNDGSTDKTLEILRNSFCDLSLTVISLARNFGHPIACAACLKYAKGDAVILMDSDLQDDPAAIPQFIEKWEAGYNAVYVVRESRQESLLHRFLFTAFYRIFQFMANVNAPLDSGNFSLMDRKMVDTIKSMPEHNRYLPGIRAYMGYSQTGIAIPRRNRYDNVSRVGFKGLFKLAFNGIFAFSYMPIRFFDLLGAVALVISIVLSSYVLSSKLFCGTAIPAWSSQMITTIFLGGINLLGLGIIGEYVARIYDEVRGFPSFTISETFEVEPKLHSQNHE